MITVEDLSTKPYVQLSEVGNSAMVSVGHINNIRNAHCLQRHRLCHVTSLIQRGKHNTVAIILTGEKRNVSLITQAEHLF